MVDFNLRLGKSKSAEDVNINNLKGGINAKKVDEKYKSIFNALDKTGQTEGVLEESEVNDLKTKVLKFAKNNIFSKHEAGKLLSSLGLKDVKAETFFGFLKDIAGISVNIETSTTDAQGNTSVAEKQGDTSLTSVYDKNGNLVSTDEITNEARVYKEYSDNGNSTKILREENGVEVEERYKNDEIIGKSEITRDADGNIKQTAIYELVNGELKQTSGKIGEKSFTRTYATDDGYTDNYDNGERKIYDAKGNAIAGKDAEGSYRIVNEDGRTYKVYNDGGYTFENNGNHYNLSRGEVIISCSDTECITIDDINTESSYDAKGNKTKEIQRDANGKVGITWEYTYDAKGNMTKKIEKDADGSEYLTEYTYDTNGNNTKKTDKDENGKVTGTTEYTYDTNGNQTKEIRKDENGKVTGTIEYTYDTNGNQTKEIYKDENCEVLWTLEYAYDTNGNQTKKIYKDENGKVLWTLEYAYDTNGNQTKKTDKDENGKVTGTTEYTYDTNGNQTKKIYKDENGVVDKVYIISNEGYDIKLTSDGDINTYAKNGESFEATMKRLGITEEDDIAIFKAANKKALSRSNGGWFKVGESEVVIPKQLVEKLNMLADTSNFVHPDRELAKWYADKRK